MDAAATAAVAQCKKITLLRFIIDEEKSIRSQNLTAIMISSSISTTTWPLSTNTKCTHTHTVQQNGGGNNGGTMKLQTP